MFMAATSVTELDFPRSNKLDPVLNRVPEFGLNDLSLPSFSMIVTIPFILSHYITI